MKNVKLVSRDKDSAVYRIKDYKQFGPKLLNEIGWTEGPKYQAFEFKAFAPRQGYLNPVVPAGCSLRVAYYARPGQIKVPAGFKPLPGLELVPAKNFPEFRELNRTSLYREYIKPYKSRLSRAFIKLCDDFIDGDLKKCRNMVIKLKGRTVGIASTAKGKAKGKPGMFIPWIWIDPKLPKAVRENARHLVAKWLRGHSTPLLYTAEHGFSKKTQKFFSSLGFKPERYIVDSLEG